MNEPREPSYSPNDKKRRDKEQFGETHHWQKQRALFTKKERKRKKENKTVHVARPRESIKDEFPSAS